LDIRWTWAAIGVLIAYALAGLATIHRTHAQAAPAPGGSAVEVAAAFPHDHLSVPSETGDAGIEVVSLAAAGQPAIPTQPGSVGIFAAAGRLDGTAGNVLLLGSLSGHGYFATLARLHRGDVVITRGAGAPTAWMIAAVHGYTATPLPQRLYRNDGARSLTLVGVSGRYDEAAGAWPDAVVVTARPVRTVVR
jgi:hypothetical protein